MGSDIRISARVLLEILAGEKGFNEFERDFGLKPGENPFKQMLESGRLISEVSIERRPDADDDVIAIKTGVHRSHAGESLHQEAGARHQEHAYCDLYHNQNV